MKLNLDLSKLSPTCQDKVVDAIVKVLTCEASGIAIVLPDYPSDSAGGKDMKGWQNAAFEIRDNLLLQAKQRG